MSLRIKIMEVKEAFSFSGWDWQRVLLGLRKPIIALIGTALTALAGQEQWAWVGGVSAAALWGTIEFYIRKI